MNAMKERRQAVHERSDVLAARRAGREAAADLGFGAAVATEIETAVAELATNLVKHARGGGELTILQMNDAGGTGIEIRSVDRGPGIADIERALAGGHSTSGSLGIGLSGVKRLMDEFAVETGPGAGTVITARKWLRRGERSLLSFSVLASPLPGEPVSGDGYFIRRFPEYELLAVIDGLGHGPKAHAVAQKCLELLDRHCREELGAIVERCHEGLRHTRGAAMALARVLRGTLLLEHISIGNVETRVYNSPSPVRPYCFNGTLGMAMEQSARVSAYRLARGAVIVMCSDGIQSRFDVPAHLSAEAPQRITEFIFQNYVRGTDDATVLTGKVAP